MSGEQNKPADPELFGRFLENQKHELTLREKALELEYAKALAAKESDERQFAFAREQLAATERDRRDERGYKQTTETKTFRLLIAFIIAVAAFLTFAVWKDKDQMIIEIIKVAVYGGSFGLGGYAYGRYRRRDGDGD